MVVFIVDEESISTQAQHVLANCNHSSSALIHLRNKTFSLTGLLEDTPIEQFMQFCQKILFSLPVLSEPCSGPTPLSRQPIYSKHKDLVEKTCRYIQQHLALPLTLDSISKAMNTNRNSLSKAFKHELNMGVSTWLRIQRMEKAWQLLVDTNLSVQEISIQLGYPSQANFSTSFKSLFKQSPIQIRRKFHDI